ncbi:hypothetical protein AB0D21_15785 [Streptomyces hundungensis]
MIADQARMRRDLRSRSRYAAQASAV